MRPKFRGPRSPSIARSQVWLGLPIGRFQSVGTCRIAAARAQWWSSCSELRAVLPKSCSRLLVTRFFDLYFTNGKFQVLDSEFCIYVHSVGHGCY